MDLLKVGKLGKSYGIKGEIRLMLEQDYDLDRVEAIFVEQSGSKVPYFVERFNYDGGPFVKFDSIDTPEKARIINGKSIYFKSEDVIFHAEPEDDYNILLGYTIYNDEELVGKIFNIEDYPQQLMAFVKIDGKDVLIPLVPDFMKDIDQDNKLLHMSLPENLVESQL